MSGSGIDQFLGKTKPFQNFPRDNGMGLTWLIHRHLANIMEKTRRFSQLNISPNLSGKVSGKPDYLQRMLGQILAIRSAELKTSKKFNNPLWQPPNPRFQSDL